MVSKKEGYHGMAEDENVEKLESDAASQSTAPAKKAKPNKPDKKGKKKPGLFARIQQWWKETRAELKKVQWPTWKQTLNNTLIVLAFCVVIGVCIWLFDLLSTQLFSALINLFHQ